MVGQCHMCDQQREIRYCSWCKHWFCRECALRIDKRAAEALKEFVVGGQSGCCGPKEN